MTAREHYAQEIADTCGIRSPALVAALAAIPRERFLGPGPWLVRGEGDLAGPRTTPDADPAHVYHNVSIAIDPARQLFNGAPSVLAALFDALAPGPGMRALHIGCGTGYYTAILGHVAGPTGRVEAIEVDESLAARATDALAEWPWIRVRHGDGTDHGRPFDVIVVNAGATHPLASWLDALADNGRLAIPLTVAMPPGSPIGKGMVLLAIRTPAGFDARFLSMVMIYNAQHVRDAALEQTLGLAMRRGGFAAVRRLRCDPHDESATCWMHSPAYCLSRE
jgi:protein-L-isoaspartate(D-aspartate) O-methyltransferase